MMETLGRLLMSSSFALSCRPSHRKHRQLPMHHGSSALPFNGSHDDDRRYLLLDNCYAEVHVPARWGMHEANFAAVTYSDNASNTELWLTDDERSVLRRLDEVHAQWEQEVVASSDDRGHALVSAKRPQVSGRDGDAGAAQVVAIHEAKSDAFTPELSVTSLLDALWLVRYRPGVVTQLDVRRQRAALIAAKKARRKEAAAAATTAAASGDFVLSPTVAPQPQLRSGFVEGCDNSSIVSRTVVSPGSRALVLLQPTLSPNLASGFLTAAAGGAHSPYSNPSLSDSMMSFDGTSFGSSMGFGHWNAAQQSADERVPRQYPLGSLRTALRAYTNVSIRALVPAPEDVEAANYNPNAIRPKASTAAYAGRDHTCRCLLDLVPLCPNIQHVSIAGHRCVSATVEAVVRLIGSQHPSLASVDLRGNVIEVPVAKALARAVCSNPRITSVLVDKDCLLLPSTERRLLALVAENAQKMRTVSKMRSEWTQTTLLPQPLPQDIAEYFASTLSEVGPRSPR